MGNDSQHVSMPELYDAAERKIVLSPEQWNHIHSCERCLLYLAHLVDVREIIEHLRSTRAA
jgi:hypothetical protein